MTSRRRSSHRSKATPFFVQQPRGAINRRVQVVGPEHFALVCIDCGKQSSTWMMADFYGKVLVEPTDLPHTRAALDAAIAQVRRILEQHDFRDQLIAIEQTGQYHRPVQRAFRAAGWETRLVHPFASKQFRQPAAAGDKTDANDLAALHRAAVLGFALVEPDWPADYRQLQLLARQRRDLVRKTSKLQCQIREPLHALLPGYAEIFGHHFWDSPIAMPLARHYLTPAALAAMDVESLWQQVHEMDLSCRRDTLAKVLAWADQAPAAHPYPEVLHRHLLQLDDDRLGKNRHIRDLERDLASLLVRTPYLLLLSIPGINVPSAAELAGELGPIWLYANANAITGRAGLMPSRYQSATVDCAAGPLRRCGNRRLRAALLLIADNLILHNDHFRARYTLWGQQGKDPRWRHIKIAKTFSRLTFALVSGGQLLGHRCCQRQHYILTKLLKFHQGHQSAAAQLQTDLHAAIEQLPSSAYTREAEPLQQRLEELARRRRGPEPLANILPIVLAKLGVRGVQSEDKGEGSS